MNAVEGLSKLIAWVIVTAIKIDDNLVDYLSKEEGVSVKGTPSSFGLINIGLTSLSLNIII